MRDISLQVTGSATLLKESFETLEQLKPSNKYPCLLIDHHTQSPLKKFPIRGNFLPEQDGKIRPILFKV